jgi:hypothetical protein
MLLFSGCSYGDGGHSPRLRIVAAATPVHREFRSLGLARLRGRKNHDQLKEAVKEMMLFWADKNRVKLDV